MVGWYWSRWESEQYLLTRAISVWVHTGRVGGALGADGAVLALQRAPGRHPGVFVLVDRPDRLVPELEPTVQRHPSSAGSAVQLTRCRLPQNLTVTVVTVTFHTATVIYHFVATGKLLPAGLV